MQFKVLRVEPGDDASQVAVWGELVHGVRLTVPLDGSPAKVKANVYGVSEARINDALAAAVGEAVAVAAGDRDRGSMTRRGFVPKDAYTGATYDNSSLGKVQRVMTGQALDFLPPMLTDPAEVPVAPQPAPEAAPAVAPAPPVELPATPAAEVSARAETLPPEPEPKPAPIAEAAAKPAK